MAIIPLFSEDFKDNNFAARGWKSSWGGSVWNPPERGFDPVLGKDWVAIKYNAGADTPHGMGDVDYHTLGTPQNEITCVWFMNVISWDVKRNSHQLSIFSNLDNITKISTPNAKLDLDFFEYAVNGNGIRSPCAGWVNRAYSGGNFNFPNPSGGNVITNGLWYEVRMYCKLNTITNGVINNNGILRGEIRQIASQDWVTYQNTTNARFLISTTGDGPNNKFMYPCFRFHRHPPGAAAGDEIRIAGWKIFQGNQLQVNLEGEEDVITQEQWDALTAKVAVLEGKVSTLETGPTPLGTRVVAVEAAVTALNDKVGKVKAAL